ncbi:MAG: amidohydrolase family protein [Thermoplasmata archaeon]|nr:amidohydrolase family protein [Thermoplasmata archaeon]
MACVTGLVYMEGEFFEGVIEVVEGVNRVGHGIREDATHRGIIIPRPFNLHTHLGDAFIPRPQGGTIEELVAPPDSLKHRMLSQVTEEEQISAMRDAVESMALSGTGAFLDFREGGMEGVRRLLLASIGIDTAPVIFGRPENLEYNEAELESLLKVVDGIGVSSITDWDPAQLADVSAHARRRNKPFALHASEVSREDMDAILDLSPSLLVHMIHASSEDLGKCADADVPIVLCPSSNSFFGLKAPIKEMFYAGVTVCLGTDNAMLTEPDMFKEMRAFRSLVPGDLLTDAGLLEVVLDNGRKVLNSILGLGARRGEYPDFLVLDLPLNDPYRSVLGASTKDVCYIHPKRREKDEDQGYNEH